MTNKLLFFIFLLSNLSVHAQQWVEKKYTYDSTLNVIYGTATNFVGGTETLKMDIYMPKCSNPLMGFRKPLLVFMHSGAFIGGDKNDWSITYLCKQFAQRGYVTASIDYRIGVISDELDWRCNFPSYECLFATDTAEGYRAFYRAVQDAKGAVRYLVNRHQQYGIDTSNIFVAGESAGGFLALGVALLDTLPEKLPQAYALSNAPKPNVNTANCFHNLYKSFSNPTILRPDLGSIEGNIEPTTINYTIKGVGNMFGGVFSDLLKLQKANKPKPAIYSFHQPCDLIVPIDAGRFSDKLSWCFTNGYNCYAIANAPMMYGSRAISKWNSDNVYGYTMQNEFTAKEFPYNYWFGEGSCVDQFFGGNACHAYDNQILRENNMAKFFANFVTSNPLCKPNMPTHYDAENPVLAQNIKIYPNPFTNELKIDYQGEQPTSYKLVNVLGQVLKTGTLSIGSNNIRTSDLPHGVYYCTITSELGRMTKLIEHY